jgi:hypothetical protein
VIDVLDREIEFILVPLRRAAVLASASPPPHATLASRRLVRPYLGRTCTG